jgi:hypothetical protein
MRRIVVLALVALSLCADQAQAFPPRRRRATPVVLQSVMLQQVLPTYTVVPPQVIRTYSYEYESYGSGGVIIQQPAPILYPRR